MTDHHFCYNLKLLVTCKEYKKNKILFEISYDGTKNVTVFMKSKNIFTKSYLV